MGLPRIRPSKPLPRPTLSLISRYLPSSLLQHHSQQTITLNRILEDEKPASFDIKAEYSDRAFELGAPAGVGKNIGSFSIQGLKPYTAKDGETHTPAMAGDKIKATFKLKTRLDGNGVISIESAVQLDEVMVPVPVEEKKPAEKKEGEGAAAEETPAEDAPAETKMKKAMRKTELKVVSNTTSLSPEELMKFQQLELEMDSSDRLVIDTAEARNALEEYVYETRSKLEMAWTEYVSDDSKVEFSKALQAMEDWLYTEEGEEATKSVYKDQLATLKKTGAPIALRCREGEMRPNAEKGFREYVNHVVLSVKSEASCLWSSHIYFRMSDMSIFQKKNWTLS